MSGDDCGRGLRLLVVEDEAMIAMLLEDMLTQLGIEVVGPAADVSAALELLSGHGAALDGALLDVTLGSEKIYPVADALNRLRLPFVFVTGYGAEGVDKAFAGTPTLAKPFRRDALSAVIAQRWPQWGAARAGDKRPAPDAAGDKL